MKCPNCKLQTNKVKAAVVYGRYIKGCDICIGLAKQKSEPSLNAPQYSRDRQKEDNAREILQPFNSDGTANSDFAHAYKDRVNDFYDNNQLKEL